jgi:two-component system sensor histidine kinase UhpB
MSSSPLSARGAGTISAPAVSDFPLSELLFVLLYLVAGAGWILISDNLVETVAHEPHEPAALQTLKGLNFVLTTAAIFYLVLRRSNSRRRAAEAESRAITERFELCARATNDALWDWNLINNEIFWSEGFSKQFGYSIEELEPTIESWTKRLHPEDKERTVTGIHKLIESGEKVWWDEYRFRRKDGSYAFVTDRGFVVHDIKGQPVRMVGGMRDVTQRKEAEMELRQSRRQLRALSARLESLREQERTRISREIHDELGQMLTGLKMDLRWIEKRLAANGQPALQPVAEKIAGAIHLTDDTIVTVQRIASELRPGALDNLGLAAALKHEAQQWEQRTGVRCVLHLPEQQLELSRDSATAIFRIFQETLTNVARHAQATEAVVELRSQDNNVILEVSDNGKGISTDALRDQHSLGLLGMKERARLLGGEIIFAPGRERGTVVTLRLPMKTSDTSFWE